MRKVIAFMHMSLDGFVSGPDGAMDWLHHDFETDGYLIADLQSTVDTILTGRVTYQSFASAWPAMAANPQSPKELVEMAHWMEDTLKVVFSKTLEKVEYGNSILAKGDLAEEVARLKQQPGKDLVIFGGASIAATFAHLDLIDEYRLKLEPVVLGSGKALFSDGQARTNLKLLKTTPSNTGMLALYYERVRG
jgi:dihydrofolate reductase